MTPTCLGPWSGFPHLRGVSPAARIPLRRIPLVGDTRLPELVRASKSAEYREYEQLLFYLE